MDHENLWSHKKFPNPIDSSEKILLILRQDTSLVKSKLTTSFGLILLIFCLKLLLQNSFNVNDNSAWFYFVNMGYYTFVCILMLKFAFFCHNYYLSFWTFTSSRILHYQQNNFFQADVYSIWFKNIESVKLKSEKIANTLNDYGDVILKIKGEGEQRTKIEMTNLPTPRYVIELLDTLIK